MTKKSLSACLTAAALASVFTIQISADTLYNETASVDLSNFPNSPTPLSFTIGNNLVYGTTGRNDAGAVDRDFFSFTVPAGLALDSITVLPDTTSAGPNSQSFIGLIAGTTFGATVPTTATDLLGYHHYTPSEIGTDILDNISSAPGAIGFFPPLGPGTYSVWIQELSVSDASYGFNFHVPDAGPNLIFTVGAFALTVFAGSRRRLV